jgi:hypothetical protein
VDPRAGLDYVEKRKLLTLPGLELQLLGRPARSQSLYLLPISADIIIVIIIIQIIEIACFVYCFYVSSFFSLLVLTLCLSFGLLS